MFKCLLFFLCCGAAVWSVPNGVRLYNLEFADQHFEEFVRLHQKQYKNEQERQMRFGIFKDNLERINKHNMESTSAVFGINHFTDLTIEEFKQSYMGYNHAPQSDECDVEEVDDVAVKKAFDWRDSNKVTRVKDQKHCGSCWAFSAVGNLEGQYAIKNNELKEFSEQQLVDCDENDDGCNGGLMVRAFMWLKDNGGIESEKDYPYVGMDMKCAFNKTKVQTTVSGCVIPNIGDHNETKLQQALVKYGPLAIGVDATMFQDYDSGILSTCFGKSLNHGVLLVGYGEENGKPFWVIKNSWGEKWGEKGYIRVPRNKNCCLVAEYIVSAKL